MKITGKTSWFGGPNDTGVSAGEDTALWEEWDQVVADGAEHLFLPVQPPNTTGLARRLNPRAHFIACRWDYNQTPRSMLITNVALVRAVQNGRMLTAWPADWGPNSDTGRVADLSHGLLEALGIITDDEVEVVFPYKAVLHAV